MAGPDDPSPDDPSPDDPSPDDPGYDPAGEVVGICRDLIRIDTTNPGDGGGPGERAAAEHVAALLDEVGIAVEVVESRPGRTSLVGRWGGTAGEPLLLHGHLDVVPAHAPDWKVPPFSGELADGYVWGRGAVDMKDFDAMLLSVVRARTRAGRLPERPVVLAFTADEEAGGHLGAEHLVTHHADLLAGCTDAVGEVGGFSTTVRDQRMYLVQAAEKGMAWMRLTARGHAGHGSMRHPDNAVTRLAAAVARIGSYRWPVRLTPPMEVLLAAVGDLAGAEVTPDNVESLVEEFGGTARLLWPVIRNTANPTRLDAGYKVNVVPGEAVAEVDGRFLPGYHEEFLATMAELVGADIEVDYLSHQEAVEAAYEGRVVDAMHASIRAEDPDALVLPYLMPAGTDGKHWARLGMRCFGFTPLRLPDDLDFSALFHGVDERVPVDALEFGARVLDGFLDLA